MNLPSFKEITNKALNAFKRFPITLTWAVAGSLLFIGIINVDPDLLFDTYTNSLLTFVLGVSWFIGMHFFIEQLKHPDKWQWLKLAILVLLILFYLHLPDMGKHDVDPKFYIRFFLFIIAGHLFVFFAPFMLKWNKASYWNYLKAICISIGRSILFSGVLYLGLVLALLAIDALFDVYIDGQRYGQLFIFCLGIVNTWTYLSDFPKNIEQQITINYNKALEVFVKYILIPLVLLYLVILYAYSIKIVLEWNLPKGWVSYLVTILALLGFIIQVMVNPVQKTIKSWTINRFYPWFYILLLPLILLLFVAIFKRIGDYGVTENRYFVLVIALWVSGITGYLLLSKKKHLRVLPISLFALAILTSFGFWGAFKVSKNSQLKQFEKVFQQVKENDNIASGKQYEQLKSIVDYLADRESVNKLDKIVGLSVHEICRDTSKTAYSTYDYYAPQKLLDSLGIKVDPKDEIVAYNRGNYYNYYSEWNTNYNYNVSEFDYFASFNYLNYDTIKMKIGKFDVRYNSKKCEILLSDKKANRIVLDIPIKEKLRSLTKYGYDLSKVDKKELILESMNDSVSLKIIFTDLGFYVEKDSINLNQAKALMFLRAPL